MAHVEKFTKAQIPGLLRHIERRFAHSSNPDIDFERTEENYSLLARSVSAYQAYIDRREELYIFNRADVVEAVGWVITLPREVEEKMSGSSLNFAITSSLSATAVSAIA